MADTNSQTLTSLSVIKSTVTSRKTTYCSEDDWREFTGFVNQNDFPSSEVVRHLKNATEQVKKDGFHMTRYEFVTKDSNGRYFVQGRYFADRYGFDSEITMKTVVGEINKYDIQVFEADVISSVASSLWLQGSRANRLMFPIPYDAVIEIDALNSFFKLSSDYPTSNRQIFVNYWMVGKPLADIVYELKRACIEYTTILALMKLKTKRLKKGTTQFTLGKQTIIRNEIEFDKMIKSHTDEYNKWIRWFRPFVGRRAKIGRRETMGRNQYLSNRYI